MMDRSWWINTPASALLEWSNSEVRSTSPSRAPQQDWAPGTHSGGLINTIAFPTLSHFSTPPPFFPRITYQINYHHQNPCLGLLWGGDVKINRDQEVTLIDWLTHLVLSAQFLCIYKDGNKPLSPQAINSTHTAYEFTNGVIRMLYWAKYGTIIKMLASKSVFTHLLAWPMHGHSINNLQVFEKMFNYLRLRFLLQIFFIGPRTQ